MSKTIRLAIFFNEELRGIKELSLPFVIGRSQEVALSIPHPMVSRRHCTVFEEQGQVFLRDLGSLNGTVMGDKRVTDVPLEDNDSFSIGTIRFVVKLQASQSPAPLIQFDSDSAVGKVVLHEASEALPEPKNEVPYVAPPHNPIADVAEIVGAFSPFSLTLEGGNGVEELHDVIDLASSEHLAGSQKKK